MPRRTSNPVDPELSAKRREAGRKGAAARWSSRPPAASNAWRQGIEAWRASRPTNAITWRIDNRAGANDEPAEMWIYDEIDAWWGISAKQIADELRSVTADRVVVHINSPGGDVFEAHTIYNNLRNHDAEIEVQIDGLAASAASYIAQAGDRVVMASNAMMMIHDAIGMTYGNEEVHLDVAARLSKLSDGIAGVYADRSGTPVDEWRTAMRAETWYDANEAVDAGLADEVSGGPAGDKNTAVDTTPYSMAGRLLPPADVPGRSDPPSGPAGDPTNDTTDIDLAAAIKALEGAFV